MIRSSSQPRMARPSSTRLRSNSTRPTHTTTSPSQSLAPKTSLTPSLLNHLTSNSSPQKKTFHERTPTSPPLIWAPPADAPNGREPTCKPETGADWKFCLPPTLRPPSKSWTICLSPNASLTLRRPKDSRPPNLPPNELNLTGSMTA